MNEKQLKVTFSQDNPRGGMDLNEWYKYIHSFENSRLKVDRDDNIEISN
ncbi:MAG: hypothetical protein ACK5XN_23210 [Bacteroidota bacterium]|jgi:hypothetical protein